MLIPNATDFPPTGTHLVEPDLQRTSSPDFGEESLFNTKDYLLTETFSEDMVRQEAIRKFQRRFDQLMLKYQKRWKTAKEAFEGISQEAVLKMTSRLAAFLLLTDPEKISIDVTPDATVFFTSAFQEFNAYFEIHFDSEEDPEIIFNIYENGAPALGYGGSFQNTVLEFLQYVFKK